MLEGPVGTGLLPLGFDITFSMFSGMSGLIEDQEKIFKNE